MPTFTQAHTVAPGDPLKASQLASLAAAFNSRILSGVGDWTWRVAFYLHSGLFRQLRNSDGAYSFPPDAEFWNIYQHVNPNDAQYPLTGPGDPEGANLANTINGFVYDAGYDLGSEGERLASIPVGFDDGQPITATRLWVLAQAQRGAYDPNTGATSWPVADVARAYAYIRQSTASPHGNSWGGWLPYAQDAGGCLDPADSNYQLLFTNLKSGATETYTTNCPEDPDRVAVAYAPFAYLIFHASGAVEVLSKSEWIEGPYEGNAQLLKTSAEALGRVLNHYASEFRGTAEQGAGATNDHAFDLQKFLTTQYPLAPQFGRQVGDGVQALYPSWSKLATSAAEGSRLDMNFGGTTWHWPDGTVCTGFLIKSQGLTRSTTIEIREGDDVLHTATLPAGDYDELFFLPEAMALAGVTVVLTEDMEAAPGGGVFVEGTALLEYKPQLHDYYLVTRLSFFGGSLDRIDGRGIDCELAKEILESLYANGCIFPITEANASTAAGFDPVLNQNAVFDAARRLSKYVRIIPRWNLTGYALDGGKSVLWFNRTAYGPPGFPDRDMWEGIGPDRTELVNGPLKWGRLYEVTKGAVTYNRSTHTAGQRFVGISGLDSFEGGGKVREYDGIKRRAEPADFSNRWALTLTLKPYHTSVSSIWKPDGFADVLTPFFNRCHFDAPEMNWSKSTKRQETYGQDPLVPEAPSGFNFGRMRDNTHFIPHLNKLDCAEDDPDCIAEKLAFYRSCRIYEPPLEIESAVMDGSELKVTLRSRLHHHGSAVGSIDRDVSTWDLTTLRTTEDYRTHENGIREYLVNQSTGINASNKVGDWALNSSGPGGSDIPFGTCFPTFILSKLIPEPYLDDNDDEDPHDSPATHDALKQAELYLRAGCEGFVDGITSSEIACRTGSISAYDYTYPNLMFQACGNRWIPLLPAEVRPDNPYGYGPLPNTEFYAATYNALAAGVNLLTDARIMLPANQEYRLLSGTAQSAINVLDACGDPLPCAGLSSGMMIYGNADLDAPASTPSAWTAGLGGSSLGYSLIQSISPGVACDGNKWRFEVGRSNAQIRWTLVDPDAYEALPGNLGALLDTNAVAAMLLSTTVTTAKLARGTITDAGGFSGGFCGSDYGYYTQTDTITYVCGGMMNSIVAPHVAGLLGLIYDSAISVTTAGPAATVGPTIYEDGTAIVRIPVVAYSGGS